VINIFEKFIQPAIRHCQADLVECGLELLLVKFAVLISIYGLEEMEKLAFSCLDEDTKLWISTLASVAKG
jgi:hypothetical protein